MVKRSTLRELEEEERREAQERKEEDGDNGVAPEPQPPSAEASVVVPPPPAQFDVQAFAAAIGIAIAANIPAIAKVMRESNIDPEKEKIKAIRKQQRAEDTAAARKAEVDKWLACDHMRTHPYSGTARIGWATQSDGHTRGTCMGCGCPFTPILSELPDPVRMKGLYERYRSVPTTIARNDFLQGMVVAGNPA